ncbi:hypothetical protein PN488_17375, partial [Nodularia spumigena CS-591/12]|nr:hypothetical protein [Nodularia spumigena CS-591/12]MDB9349814.1 hypothetical protein [Nodularia spumigena CS-588/01]MDB9353310.1 hypothetical protein [Nodularia spumigena CS-588/05]
VSTTVKIYGQRFGIEAMFKDCKTGGYNLEGSQASPDRLVRLILLIARILVNLRFFVYFLTKLYNVSHFARISAATQFVIW